MRAQTLSVVVAVTFAISFAGPAPAQDRVPGGSASITTSPSGSPTPGPRGDGRRPGPGFVVLFVLLGLGLLWQVQRARRTTADVSAHTLEDLERTTQPRPPPPDRSH